MFIFPSLHELISDNIRWNNWSCKLYLERKVQLRHFYKKQIIISLPLFQEPNGEWTQRAHSKQISVSCVFIVCKSLLDLLVLYKGELYCCPHRCYLLPYSLLVKTTGNASAKIDRHCKPFVIQQREAEFPQKLWQLVEWVKKPEADRKCKRQM